MFEAVNELERSPSDELLIDLSREILGLRENEDESEAKVRTSENM